MKCPKCDRDLMISSAKPESPIDSTDVFMVQKMVCNNNKCSNFCGKDMTNPTKIVDTVRNKIN